MTAVEQKQVKQDEFEELNRFGITPEGKYKTGSRHRSPMNAVQLFFLHAFLIMLIVWVLFGCVCGLTSAPNNDMSPQIKVSDLILYDRINNNIHAQDIVVLKKNHTEYLGRVVAVAGDTVEITDEETLRINGNAVSEQNIFHATPRFEGFTDYPLTLGKGEYFILCDSRESAEDSRYYGVVSRKEITGTVISFIRRNNL